MGDRAQVRIVEGPESVYLYTHWSGYRIMSDLKEALIRGRSRWEDAPYLTRIIFCEMVKDYEGIVDYGIWSGEMDGKVVTVDVDSQTVSADGFGYGTMQFEDFIKLDVPVLD